MYNEVDHKGEQLVETVKDYVNTRYDLTRLKIIHAASDIMANLIAYFFLIAAGLFFLFFISYAIATYLCAVTETKSGGYFIVAGFYLVVSLVLLVIKKNSVHVPLENHFIRQFLK
jgi:hypothetical protein